MVIILRWCERALPVIVFVVCIFLVLQNWRLRNKNEYLAERIKLLNSHEGPVTGTVFPMLVGKDEKGENSKLEYGSLVLFYSTTCRFCKEQLPDWRILTKQSKHVKIFVITYSDLPITPQQFSEMELPSETHLLLVDRHDLNQNYLKMTPSTLLLGTDGTILDSQTGVMDSYDYVHFEHLLENQNNNDQTKGE